MFSGPLLVDGVVRPVDRRYSGLPDVYVCQMFTFAACAVKEYSQNIGDAAVGMEEFRAGVTEFQIASSLQLLVRA